MKTLTPEEEKLWKIATEGMIPLKKDAIFIHNTFNKHNSSQQIKRRYNESEKDRLMLSLLSFNESPKFLSKQIKLSRKIHLESRLDLHGYTFEEAWVHLQRFLVWAQAQGYTWVLIITGKGSKSLNSTSASPGVLKQTVPLWLNQNAQVGAFCSAKPQHGGQGALYVRLKRITA